MSLTTVHRTVFNSYPNLYKFIFILIHFLVFSLALMLYFLYVNIWWPITYVVVSYMIIKASIFFFMCISKTLPLSRCSLNLDFKYNFLYSLIKVKLAHLIPLEGLEAKCWPNYITLIMWYITSRICGYQFV